MIKVATAALAAVFALGISNAFAQQASGPMSQTEMASGTMAKHPVPKSKMKRPHKKTDEGDSMGMKPGASGAMGQ